MALSLFQGLDLGLGLLGDALGFGSQQSANSTNLQIAQMNNEFNERMMEKQMAWNEEMWNKSNEYNSAASQVKRLREAGLNPALNMGNGAAGQAAAAGGVTAPTAQGVTVNPYIPNLGNAQSAIRAALELNEQKLNNQVTRDNMVTDNLMKQVGLKTQYAEALARIDEIKSRTRGHNAQAYLNEVEGSVRRDMLGADYALKIQQIRREGHEIENLAKQGLMLGKELAWFDERARAAIADQTAGTLLKVAQRDLTKNQARTEIMRTLDAYETAEGKKLDNGVKRRTADYLVDKAYRDAYMPNGILDLGFIGSNIRAMKRFSFGGD